jgi:hypothetical protein
MSSRMLEPSLEGRLVIRLKGRQSRFKQPGPGHHDDVEAWRNLAATEDLSYQSLSAISLDGSPQLLRGGDSEASDRLLVGEDEQCAVTTLNLLAPLVHSLKFDAATDPLVRSEPPGHKTHSWLPASAAWRMPYVGVLAL